MANTKQQFSDLWNKKIKAKKQEEENDLNRATKDFNTKMNNLMYNYNKLLFQKGDIYRVGIVGELKSGKSTFLNSILGASLLHTQSSVATAFPLRIVQNKDIQGISLRYIYHKSTIKDLRTNLNNTKIPNDDKALLLKLIDDNLSNTFTNLNSKDIFKCVEELNNTLRIVYKNNIIPVEEFLTSVVLEITLNFKSYDLHQLKNPIDNTVLIDSPGIGEEENLNKIFKKLTEHIITHLDHAMIILEYGGRNTESENEVIKMLEKSQAFSVIASKLDNYKEDIHHLLEVSLPNKFKDSDKHQKIFGVSQQDFLMANKILSDFSNHGKILDNREPYIAKLVNKVYGRKDVQKYQNKEEGYEELLNESDSFINVIREDYLDSDYQQIHEVLKYLALESLKFYSKFLHKDTESKLKTHNNNDKNLINKVNKFIKSSNLNTDDTMFKDITYNLFTVEVYDKLSYCDTYIPINKLIKYGQTCLINGEELNYKEVDYLNKNINPQDWNNFTITFEKYFNSSKLPNKSRLEFLQLNLISQYSNIAILGDTDSMISMGLLYENGFYGVDQNYWVAMEWYQKSADLGNAKAMNNLAILYENGYGVGQDYTVAMEWYQKSARLGKSNAMKNIGFLYENGYGVDQDYTIAMEWYQKSADLCNAKAMNKIGSLYRNGYGVDKNYGIAIQWYYKAVALDNYKTLRKDLDIVKDLLQNSSDLGTSKAKSLIESWKKYL